MDGLLDGNGQGSRDEGMIKRAGTRRLEGVAKRGLEGCDGRLLASCGRRERRGWKLVSGGHFSSGALAVHSAPLFLCVCVCVCVCERE